LRGCLRKPAETMAVGLIEGGGMLCVQSIPPCHRLPAAAPDVARGHIRWPRRSALQPAAACAVAAQVASGYYRFFRRVFWAIKPSVKV
jgi:hypothetical protein